MKRTAFTLIELLVVVAIIVALLAILLPSMGAAVSVSQATVCASNQRQLTAGAQAFSFDSLGLLIGAEYLDAYSDTKNPWVLTDNRNGETVKTIEDGSMWKYVGGAYKLYLCPNEDRGYIRSYSVSTYLHGHDGTYYAGDVPAKRVSDVVSPSQRLAFVDDADPRGSNWGSFHGGPWSYHKTQSVHYWGDYPAARHGPMLPHTFADGSAVLYRYEDDVAMRAASYGTLVTNNGDFEYMRRIWSPYN